jgi:hypothetical protein
MQRPAELVLVVTCGSTSLKYRAVDTVDDVHQARGEVEGLILGASCGDVDTRVLAFFERERGLTAGRCEEILNRRSGLLGLCGISNDMREVLKAAEAGFAGRVGDHGVLLSRAEGDRRLRRGPGRTGCVGLHGRCRPGQRESSRPRIT